MNDGTVVSGGTTVLSSMRQQSLNTAALDWEGEREREMERCWFSFNTYNDTVLPNVDTVTDNSCINYCIVSYYCIITNL